MSGEKLNINQAALRLGVSRQRIRQLIESGALEGEKIGSFWVVSKESVERRAAHPTRVGRPVRVKVEPDKQDYTLMNGDYEVLDFTYDRANRHFSASHTIHDATRAPIGVMSARGTYAPADALYDWWRHRSIPVERDGMDSRLIELGVDEPMDIPFMSLGLSLSDQYWIRPKEHSDLRWEDINLFDFNFISHAGGWLENVGEQNSPDNTSEGQLPKRWACIGNRRVLYKGGGSVAQLPVNELVAAKLHARVLGAGEFVPYSVEVHGGQPVSVCEDFLTRREEYIPAWYLRPRGKKADGRHALNAYVETCEGLGVANAEDALSKMLVCDFILANTDRHWRNFGLVRNIDTLECHVAPLFDSGNSLWHDLPLRMLQEGDFSFAAKPFNANPVKQLLMTPDTDWLDIDALDGFAQEVCDTLVAYEQPIERAELVAAGVARAIEQVRVRLL